MSSMSRRGHARCGEAARSISRSDHDVSQNIEALVSAITAPPPFRVLDLGCGPGRDLKAFLARIRRSNGRSRECSADPPVRPVE
jgi:ubiquinone/menaquinone biosynthesis C-methylase UbiE